MRITQHIDTDTVMRAAHMYESLGGPQVLELEIGDVSYDFYCNVADLKRLIDTLQSAYDNSLVLRRQRRMDKEE